VVRSGRKKDFRQPASAHIVIEDQLARRQRTDAAAAERTGQRAEGGSGGRGTRARGPPPEDPIRDLTLPSERKMAHQFLGSCCLRHLCHCGCSFASCKFSHVGAPDASSFGPVVWLVVTAAGGLKTGPPIPPEDRPALIADFRRLATLKRGHGASSPSATPPAAGTGHLPTTTSVPPGPAWAAPGLELNTTARHPLGQPLVRALSGQAP